MLLAVAALAAVGWFYSDLLEYADQPADPNAKSITFEVGPGEGFGTITQNFYARGLFEHPDKFKLLARFKGYDKKIRAGEYELSAAMSPRQILQRLVSGKVRLYRLTIPEGYTLQQIAAAVAKVGLGNTAQFLTAAANSELLTDLGIPAKNLEGYLYPDTYFFPKGVTGLEIVRTMAQRFQTIFKPEWETRAKTLKMSVHAILTLASIIEKETGTALERPLISSVFHNRLKRKMRLETDPTVIYGIPNFNGNLTRKDLTTPTPYNTYLIRGLPPGPIANPGAKAIEAALYPAGTDYIFFVSKKDTTHQFSTNIKDHNAAVRKYQLRRK
ncbi:MAG: endolytic transglycosylase MltG [Desulfobacterales bacterium]|nr:endolytic transglycosylase MltG [Desulfobacterales bacterium]